MNNVILRIIGSVGLAVTVGLSFDLVNYQVSLMGGFIYVLFSTTGDSK
tara:strand:+ start:410 stop:553 length:144 start_codon:yes stop_codon:yes gene_type:complete